jgi:hypothetical protein
MGTNRFSVRLPNRILPVCVIDPNSRANPLRAANTPAKKVVVTAPMPGINTPSLPL